MVKPTKTESEILKAFSKRTGTSKPVIIVPSSSIEAYLVETPNLSMLDVIVVKDEDFYEVLKLFKSEGKRCTTVEILEDENKNET